MKLISFFSVLKFFLKSFFFLVTYILLNGIYKQALEKPFDLWHKFYQRIFLFSIVSGRDALFENWSLFNISLYYDFKKFFPQACSIIFCVSRKV